jgi:LysM repeat protein
MQAATYHIVIDHVNIPPAHYVRCPPLEGYGSNTSYLRHGKSRYDLVPLLGQGGARGGSIKNSFGKGQERPFPMVLPRSFGSSLCPFHLPPPAPPLHGGELMPVAESANLLLTSPLQSPLSTRDGYSTQRTTYVRTVALEGGTDIRPIREDVRGDVSKDKMTTTRPRLFALITFLMLFSLSVQAQFEWAYHTLISEGLALRDSNDYQLAIRKFQAAGRADPNRAEEAERYILEVFNAIEAQKDELAEAQEETKAALSRAQNSLRAKQIAEENRKKAEDARRRSDEARAEAQAQNQRLAGYFFKPGSTEPAAWAYGPNGKFGVVNREGILQGEGFVWEEPDTFRSGMAIAQRGGEYYVVGASGLELSRAYAQLHPTDHRLWAGFRKDSNSFAVYDTAWRGEIMGMWFNPQKQISTTMHSAPIFLARSVGYAFVDYEGREVIPPYFAANTRPFASGGAIFQGRNEKWGLIDKMYIRLEPLYDGIEDFQEGYAVVTLNGQKGLIDSTGTEVFQPVYEAIGQIHEQTVPVRKDGKWALRKVSGETILPFIYDGIAYLNAGRFMFRLGENQGLMDQEGKVSVQGDYRSLSIGPGGFIMVEDSQGQSGILHPSGEMLTIATVNETIERYAKGYFSVVPKEPQKYQIIHTVRPGETLFSLYRKYGVKVDEIRRFNDLQSNTIKVGQKLKLLSLGDYIQPLLPAKLIDTLGQSIASNPGYELLYTGFSEGLIPAFQVVDTSNVIAQWGFADKTGALVIPLIYDDVLPCSENLIWARDTLGWQLIHRSGEPALDEHFDDVHPFKNGRARVSREAKWGLIDSLGKELISLEYDYFEPKPLQSSNDLYYLGLKNRLHTLFDQNGKRVFDQIAEAKDFDQGKIWVQVEGNWGLIDTLGKTQIAFEYVDVAPFSEGLARVQAKSKYGVYNQFGKELVFPLYDEMTDFENGRAIVRRGNFWGIIYLDGRVLLPFDFHTIHPFSEGLARVQQGDRWGYVNEFMELVIPLQYTEARDFVGGLAWVRDTTLWGCLDVEGKTIFDFRYRYEGKPVSEGRIWVENKLYDSKGNPISPTQYQTTSQFREGFARVQDFNGRHGFVDRQGRERIALVYDRVEDFQFGLAKVEKRNRWGVVDSNGSVVIKPKYTLIDLPDPNLILAARLKKRKSEKYRQLDKKGWLMFNRQGTKLPSPRLHDVGTLQHGLAIVGNEQGKKGLINSQGQMLQPMVYDEINNFADNRAWFKKGDWVGYFGPTGEIIIPAQFPEAYRFADGFAISRDPERRDWVFIDTLGQRALPTLYRNYIPFDSLLIRVYDGEQYGLINAAGEEVLPIKYESIFRVGIGLASFKKEGLMGVVNHQGKVLISPVDYSGIGSFKRGLAVFSREGRYGILDTLGRELVPPVYLNAVVPDDGFLWTMEVDEKYLNSQSIPSEAVTYHYFFTNGEEADTPAGHDAIRGYSEGMAAVSDGYGRYGFVNEYRQLSVPIRYYAVEDFSEGLAAVKTFDGSPNYLDREGNTVFELPDFDYTDRGSMKFNGGLAKVYKGNKVGLIDSSGQVIFYPDQYDDITFYDEFVVFQSNQKYGFVNRDRLRQQHRRQIIRFDFAKVDFEEIRPLGSFIKVKSDSKYGIYKKSEIQILKPDYDQITQVGPLSFKLEQSDRIGMLKLKPGSQEFFSKWDESFNMWVDNGNPQSEFDYLIPCEYEAIGRVPKGDLIPVRQNGKWGFLQIIPREGKPGKPQLVIPHRYDAATPFFESHGQRVARVYIENINQIFYINEKGEMLVEAVSAEQKKGTAKEANN